MKLDLFSVPFWITNIDLDKIKLNNLKFSKTFLSETLSSHDYNNKLEENSEKYLLEVIVKTLLPTIKPPFKVIMDSIWENQYLENDFQEKHEHPGKHISFVIYKKILNHPVSKAKWSYFLVFLHIWFAKIIILLQLQVILK